MATGELRAAAERVRLYADGNLGNAEISDRNTLAVAYLAEHPADEDEPISAGWLTGCTFYQNLAGDSFRLGVFLVIYLKWDDKGARTWAAEVAAGMSVPVATRGDVRRLCAALGIPLTEGKPNGPR